MSDIWNAYLSDSQAYFYMQVKNNNLWLHSLHYAFCSLFISSPLYVCETHYTAMTETIGELNTKYYCQSSCKHPTNTLANALASAFVIHFATCSLFSFEYNLFLVNCESVIHVTWCRSLLIILHQNNKNPIITKTINNKFNSKNPLSPFGPVTCSTVSLKLWWKKLKLLMLMDFFQSLKKLYTANSLKTDTSLRFNVGILYSVIKILLWSFG